MAKANRKSASAPAPAPAAETTLALTVAPAQSADALRESRERALFEIAQGNGRSANFALSLLMAIRSGKASENQQQWADRLADEHLNPTPALNCTRVMEAYRALPPNMTRFPKMRTEIDGVEIVLSYTPVDSEKANPENRGTCSIASGKYRTPSSKYYGRIMQDGNFVPGSDLTPAVREWLVSLATDAVFVWQWK